MALPPEMGKPHQPWACTGLSWWTLLPKRKTTWLTVRQQDTDVWRQQIWAGLWRERQEWGVQIGLRYIAKRGRSWEENTEGQVLATSLFCPVHALVINTLYLLAPKGQCLEYLLRIFLFLTFQNSHSALLESIRNQSWPVKLCPWCPLTRFNMDGLWECHTEAVSQTKTNMVSLICEFLKWYKWT